MDLNQKVPTTPLKNTIMIFQNDSMIFASPFRCCKAHSSPIHYLQCRPVFRKQEFIELRDSVRVVLVLAYPWEDDSVVVQRCVMKLTGVLHHVVELVAIEHIKVIVSEIQPGVLEGIKKILDDHTMGGTLSETRMKYILKEC